MSKEKHHHVEMEKITLSKSKLSHLSKSLNLTKPFDIEKCKSKNEASVSETLALFTAVLKSNMIDHVIKEGIINI